MQKLKQVARFLGLRSAAFRSVLLFARHWIRRLQYQVEKWPKVEPRRFLFQSYNGKSYSCNPKAVYEYLRSDPDFDDCEFVWAFQDAQAHSWLAANPHTIVVSYASKAHRDELKRCKYWIFNQRVFDFVHPRPGQVFLQCWHGTPLKRLGFDLQNYTSAMNTVADIRQKYSLDTEKMTWLLSPSPFATNAFTSAWNLEAAGRTDIVLEVGYPRNDVLALAGDDAAQSELVKSRLRAELGIENGKQVVLYTPTYRDDQYGARTGVGYQFGVDFERLRDAIGANVVIAARTHYYISNAIDLSRFRGFVYDFSDHDDINDLYLASDMMVTDYSSTMFDYANLGKPMVYYMYDLDRYESDIRGFYIDLAELPGQIVRKEAELASAIKSALAGSAKLGGYNGKYASKYRAFQRKYNPLDDGQATGRLVSRIVV